jgi:hypothetical protein
MRKFDRTKICSMCDGNFVNGHACHCEACEGTNPVKVIMRGDDEYIVLNGQVVLRYGAPVGGSEPARFRIHEDYDLNPSLNLRIELPVHIYMQQKLKDEVWPEIPGVFTNDDVVDMYRLLKTSRLV